MLLPFGMNTNYRIIVDRINNLDKLEIQIEMSGRLFSNSVGEIKDIESKIAQAIQSNLNISAKIKLLEPKSIPRVNGKIKKVIDKRI